MKPEEWKSYVPTLTTRYMRQEYRKYIEKAFGLPLPKTLEEEVKKLENIWYECESKTSWDEWLNIINKRYQEWSKEHKEPPYLDYWHWLLDKCFY